MFQLYKSEGSQFENRLIQFRKHGGDLGGHGNLGGEGDLGGRRFGRLCLDSRRQQDDLVAKGQTLASHSQV